MQFADLMRLFREGQNEGRKRGYVSQGACDAEGIAAVVRALRDEFGRIMYPGDDWNRQGILEQFDQILGDAGNEKVAGSTPEGAVLSSSAEGEPPASPATDPAPAPCLWRVHHETRNGPLYVSQCDGEWRHATADPKCPACKKEIFFVTDPAPAVCEWAQRGRDEPGFYATPHGLCHINHLPRSGGCWCGKPIKFTEAK